MGYAAPGLPGAPASDGIGDEDPEREDADPSDERALLVSLGDRWLAVRAAAVDAVVRPAPVTPVGGTPRWVSGVAGVRGAVVAVVDASRLAGAGSAEPGDGGWWVVVTGGGRAVALAGLRVWRVARVRRDEAGVPADGAADAAPAPPGLPAGAVVRLAEDTGRGADALPPAARLLDEAALLDLVHDPTHEP